jgi:LacI family transcriptional regulator, galactose operon repressor
MPTRQITEEPISGRRPSLRDVADKAGVALSTASRAISGQGNVSADIRERVLAAASDLGYELNLLAQSLRRGSSMSIGFVVRDISNPMMAEIVLGAERELRAAGYSLSVTNSEGESALDAEYIRYFRQRAVDGLLLSLSDERDHDTHEELRNLALPFVAVDRELAPDVGGTAVYCDHAEGIEVAARYLVSLGHRRIGLVAGPETLRPGREAGRALEAFAAENKIACQIEYGAFSREAGERALGRFLTARERPTAVIVGGYQPLLGVLAAARAFDVSVPEQLSVISFDDPDALEFFDPPITSLSREPLELGRAAARQLLAQLRGADPAGSNAVIKPVFWPRASCTQPPAL